MSMIGQTDPRKSSFDGGVLRGHSPSDVEIMYLEQCRPLESGGVEHVYSVLFLFRPSH